MNNEMFINNYKQSMHFNIQSGGCFEIVALMVPWWHSPGKVICVDIFRGQEILLRIYQTI